MLFRSVNFFAEPVLQLIGALLGFVDLIPQLAGLEPQKAHRDLVEAVELAALPGLEFARLTGGAIAQQMVRNHRRGEGAVATQRRRTPVGFRKLLFKHAHMFPVAHQFFAVPGNACRHLGGRSRPAPRDCSLGYRRAEFKRLDILLRLTIRSADNQDRAGRNATEGRVQQTHELRLLVDGFVNSPAAAELLHDAAQVESALRVGLLATRPT